MTKARPNFAKDLRTEFDRYSSTAEALALDLRLDVAEIIVARLNALGWTQRDLAEATGMKESFISRVIHSNANCTLATIAKLLAALNVRASLVEASPGRRQTNSLREAALQR